MRRKEHWHCGASGRPEMNAVNGRRRFPSPAYLFGTESRSFYGFGLIILLTSCAPSAAIRSPEKTSPPFAQESGSKNFIWPVKGKVISIFGTWYRGTINKGIDIQTGEGSPVYAAQSGMVSFIHENMSGLGKTILLDHGDNYSTVYAHVGEILVQRGQRVFQGQVIARSGKSDQTPVSALHFEIRKLKKPENPFYHLPE